MTFLISPRIHGDRMTDQSEARGLSQIDRSLFLIETGFNLIAAFSIFGLMLLGVVQVLGRILLWINKLLVEKYDIDPGIWYSMPGYIDIMEQAIAIFAFWASHTASATGGPRPHGPGAARPVERPVHL